MSNRRKKPVVDTARARDLAPAEKPAEISPELSAQSEGKVVDANSFKTLETPLEGVAWDPIVLFMMRREGLSKTSARNMIKSVQELLADRPAKRAPYDATAFHQQEVAF
jgi:hypothetical protein